jgi:hypothetical protein
VLPVFVTVSSMWFTGRFNGAATVRVLEPSHVTALPEEAGALAAVVCRGVGFEPPDPACPELPGASDDAGSAAEGDADAAGAEAGAVEPAAPGPVFAARAPVPPSPHAVRESAASATAAAAPGRRIPEVRMPDMVCTSFAAAADVVLGWQQRVRGSVPPATPAGQLGILEWRNRL